MSNLDKVEALDRVLEIRREQEALKRLEDSEGWSRLLDRLEQLLTNKERVKANLLRQGKLDEAYALQNFIDGINFVMSEPDRIISAVDSSDSEQEN